MSASLAVICHQLDANTDHTTSQLLNGITSLGVEACLYSSQDIISNIGDFDQFDGFVFEASSSQSMDQIVKAFSGAATMRKETGLWRDKLAAGFSKESESEAHSLRAMMDFSIFCNSQNMVWLSSGIQVDGIGEHHPAMNSSMGNAPVLEGVLYQAYRHGQYLASVAQRWQPDN